MAKNKIKVAVHAYPNAQEDEYARAWVPRSLASRWDVKEEEWIYLSRDWIGVLSTQAKVELVLDTDETDIVYLSPDRMKDAHFTEGLIVDGWKFSEWD
jgi:hypothetical protein